VVKLFSISFPLPTFEDCLDWATRCVGLKWTLIKVRVVALLRTEINTFS